MSASVQANEQLLHIRNNNTSETEHKLFHLHSQEMGTWCHEQEHGSNTQLGILGG